MAFLSFGVALVAVAAAQAAPVSVDEILSNPDRFDGQMVTVEGTITDLKRRVTRSGDPFYKFYLSDGKQAIRVISLGSPPCQSGAVTVEGTFAKIKRGRLSVSYNVVSASRVICRQEKSRDEPWGLGMRLPVRRGLNRPQPSSPPTETA
jgi:hypothetical protein